MVEFFAALVRDLAWWYFMFLVYANLVQDAFSLKPVQGSPSLGIEITNM